MKKISEILKETREKKGLSLEEVENETKIKKEFLAAIESGQYNLLPSESYAQGFVRNYSKHLGIPQSLAIPLFRREYKAKHGFHIIPEFRKSQHKFKRRFIFNAKTLAFTALALLIGIYVFFQYSSFFFPPQLSITAPKEGQEITGNIVEISGKTDPYATISINKTEVYVALDGTFKKSEYMFSGDNKIIIVAKNRYGKETQKVLNVKVK
jgi:cytoskeletal protein RodZ